MIRFSIVTVDGTNVYLLDTNSGALGVRPDVAPEYVAELGALSIRFVFTAAESTSLLPQSNRCPLSSPIASVVK